MKYFITFTIWECSLALHFAIWECLWVLFLFSFGILWYYFSCHIYIHALWGLSIFLSFKDILTDNSIAINIFLGKICYLFLASSLTKQIFFLPFGDLSWHSLFPLPFGAISPLVLKNTVKPLLYLFLLPFGYKPWHLLFLLLISVFLYRCFICHFLFTMPFWNICFLALYWYVCISIYIFLVPYAYGPWYFLSLATWVQSYPQANYFCRYSHLIFLPCGYNPCNYTLLLLYGDVLWQSCHMGISVPWPFLFSYSPLGLCVYWYCYIGISVPLYYIFLLTLFNCHLEISVLKLYFSFFSSLPCHLGLTSLALYISLILPIWYAILEISVSWHSIFLFLLTICPFCLRTSISWHYIGSLTSIYPFLNVIYFLPLFVLPFGDTYPLVLYIFLSATIYLSYHLGISVPKYYFISLMEMSPGFYFSCSLTFKIILPHSKMFCNLLYILKYFLSVLKPTLGLITRIYTQILIRLPFFGW